MTWEHGIVACLLYGAVADVGKFFSSSASAKPRSVVFDVWRAGPQLRRTNMAPEEARLQMRLQKAGLTADAVGQAQAHLEQLSAAYAQFCDGKRPRAEPLLYAFKSQREISAAVDSLALAIIDSSPGGTRRWAEDGMF